MPALVSRVEAASEADYQRRLCAGLAQEVELSDGTRADCLSPTHAIEVEFSEKWAEALGQALHYAAVTGKEPGIFLICRQAERLCLQHGLRLEETIAHWQLPVVIRRFSAISVDRPGWDTPRKGLAWPSRACALRPLPHSKLEPIIPAKRGDLDAALA